MKKFLLLVLLAAGLYGCKDDPQDGVKLVSNVVMPSGQSYGPGAEVMVTAEGFRNGDGVLIRRGAVIRDAETLEVQPTQIRFLVPSGFPAGTADVLLMRGGRYMVLGQIALLDGLAPEDYRLYGISRKDGRTQIDSIMVNSGHIMPYVTLAAGEDIAGAVNAVSTNSLYGVYDGQAVQYNLTTKRYRESGVTNVLAMGTLGTGTPVYLKKVTENVVTINSTGLTRAVGPQPSLQWELPAGVTPQMLVGTPFVSTSDNCLLLVAKTGEGRFLPVVFEMTSPFRAKTGDAINADGVVPFRAALVLDGSVTPSLVGGLAVAQGGETILKTFIPSSLTYSRVIGRIPGVVRSCTAWITGDGTERFFLLSQVDEKMVVSRYVIKKLEGNEYKGDLTTLVEDAPFSEIVLAR